MNSCKLKSKVGCHRIKFGRGKKFEFKFISEDKVLVYKKGVELVLTKDEFYKNFEICTG